MEVFSAVDHSGTGRLALNGPARCRPSRPSARIHATLMPLGLKGARSDSSREKHQQKQQMEEEERQRPFPVMQSAR